jgi:peptidoglycan-associated lipoprotein
MKGKRFTVCPFFIRRRSEMKKFAGFLVLVIVFGVTGCASKSSESVVSQDSAVSPGSGYGQDSGRIYSESEAALRDEARRVLKDVFFAFESAEIDDQAALQLKNNAIWMRANPSVSVTIEGHCDERGTSEYNMALGERRADMAKSFLVKAGVRAERINTVSYGEERPFDPGHDEAAWAQNRRAHFVVE